MRVMPTMRLTDTDMPEMGKMEVGKKYNLNMEVEVMAMSQGSEWNQNDKDKSMRTTFKITKVGCEDMEDKKEEKKATTSGKDFEMEYAKKRSGGTGSRFDK